MPRHRRRPLHPCTIAGPNINIKKMGKLGGAEGERHTNLGALATCKGGSHHTNPPAVSGGIPVSRYVHRKRRKRGGLRQGRYGGGDRSREQTNKQTNLAQADAQCETVTTEHRGIGVVRHIDDDPTPVRASAASLGKNGNLYLFPEIFPEIKQSNARNGKRKFGSPAAEFSVKPKWRPASAGVGSAFGLCPVWCTSTSCWMQHRSSWGLQARGWQGIIKACSSAARRHLAP
jgi:hypothetical protein